MVTENDSLGGQGPENENGNFLHFLLVRAALNWIMKCDGRFEFNHVYIYNVYILYV